MAQPGESCRIIRYVTHSKPVSVSASLYKTWCYLQNRKYIMSSEQDLATAMGNVQKILWSLDTQFLRHAIGQTDRDAHRNNSHRSQGEVTTSTNIHQSHTNPKQLHLSPTTRICLVTPTVAAFSTTTNGYICHGVIGCCLHHGRESWNAPVGCSQKHPEWRLTC